LADVDIVVVVLDLVVAEEVAGDDAEHTVLVVLPSYNTN